MGLGIGTGLCLGVAFGIIFHNFAMGIGIGLLFGLAFDYGKKRNNTGSRAIFFVIVKKFAIIKFLTLIPLNWGSFF